MDGRGRCCYWRHIQRKMQEECGGGQFGGDSGASMVLAIPLEAGVESRRVGVKSRTRDVDVRGDVSYIRRCWHSI
jgi:hypothetical protein